MTKTKTIDLEVVTGGAERETLKSISRADVRSTATQTSLKERRDRIISYHQGFMGAFAQQTGYAYLAGVELHAAKLELPHGQFIKWREENLAHISKGSVANYMLFAEALQSKFPTVGNLTAERLQLTNGRLRDDDQKIILEAVHEAADGSSLTRLYRELGVIKTPKSQAERDASAKKELSPAEAAAEEKAANIRIGEMILTDHELATAEVFAHWPDDLRARVIDSCITLGKALRALKKKSPRPNKVGRGRSRSDKTNNSSDARRAVTSKGAK